MSSGRWHWFSYHICLRCAGVSMEQGYSYLWKSSIVSESICKHQGSICKDVLCPVLPLHPATHLYLRELIKKSHHHVPITPITSQILSQTVKESIYLWEETFFSFTRKANCCSFIFQTVHVALFCPLAVSWAFWSSAGAWTNCSRQKYG